MNYFYVVGLHAAYFIHVFCADHFSLTVCTIFGVGKDNALLIICNVLYLFNWDQMNPTHV